MKLKHQTPCNECPWRLSAPKGWLGGHSAEFYADSVAMNDSPACHLSDHGPDSPKTAFCVGALACAANACIVPYHQEGAREARVAIGKREDVFSHPSKFYEHHTNRPYMHPLLRKAAG